MQDGIKLSISIQGITGSGRTHSSLIMLNGARKIIAPNDYIVYVGWGEGSQINFYKKDFNNLIIEIVPYDADLEFVEKLIKQYYNRSDVFAVILDTVSRMWQKTDELANINGGLLAKPGSNESGWSKYKRRYNKLLDYLTHEGKCWFVGILLDTPKTKPITLIESGMAKSSVKDLGDVEIAEKTSRSRFDINIRTIVMTGKLKRNDNNEVIQTLTDKKINTYAQGEEHIKAGFFKILKQKGGASNPFPLSVVAPRGSSSDRPMNEEDGASLAKWMLQF